MITSFVYEEMGVEGGVKHLNLNLYLNCSRAGEGTETGFGGDAGINSHVCRALKRESLHVYCILLVNFLKKCPFS